MSVKKNPFARTCGLIFREAPISAAVTMLFKIVEGLFPTYVTILSARLFSRAALLLQDAVSVKALYMDVLLLLAGYVCKHVLTYVGAITLNAGVYEKINSRLRVLICEKSARLSMLQYEDPEILDMQKRAERNIRTENMSTLFMTYMYIGIGLCGILSIAAALAAYHWLFLAVCALSVVPFLIIRLLRSGDIYLLRKKQAREERKKQYYWKLLTSKQSVKEMRVMSAGRFWAEKWKTSRDLVNEESWSLTKKDARSMIFCNVLKIVGYGVSILLAWYLIHQESISVGVFGACLIAVSSVQSQMQDVLSKLGGLREKIGYAQDYYAYLDLPEEPERSDEIPGAFREIHLEEVCFSYPGASRPAVDHVTLDIRRGEKIALVGENGSGKTTLTRMLLGAYEPDSGSIFINEAAYEVLNKDSLRKHMSLVQQDFVQYQMSLRNNVAMSDISYAADDARIFNALEKAGAGMGDINLDTVLGTRFGNTELSGGQWQKLAIARGIFRDSELAILDEPTSALDPALEWQVLEKFLRIAEEKTALIVSHRIGICTQVDRILVMKDGRIVEDGSHQELLQRNGEYARLWHTQEQWYV